MVLDTTLNDQLIEEGFVREIVSKLQSMRKDAGFNVVDHIEVYHQGSQKIAQVLRTMSSPSSPTLLGRGCHHGPAGRLYRPVGHQRRDHHFRREEAVRRRLYRTKKRAVPGTALSLCFRRLEAPAWGGCLVPGGKRSPARGAWGSNFLPVRFAKKHKGAEQSEASTRAAVGSLLLRGWHREIKVLCFFLARKKEKPGEARHKINPVPFGTGFILRMDLEHVLLAGVVGLVSAHHELGQGHGVVDAVGSFPQCRSRRQSRRR